MLKRIVSNTQRGLNILIYKNMKKINGLLIN